MKSKELIRLLLVVSLVLTLTALTVGACAKPAPAAPAGQAWPKDLSYAAVSGTTMNMAMALSSLAQKYLKVNIIVEPMTGTDEGPIRLSKGEFDLSAAGGSKAVLMLTAGKGYEDVPTDTFRSMLFAHETLVHVVARANSGINSMADMKGKRFSYGGPAQALLDRAFRAILTAAGLDPSKDVIQLPLGEKTAVATGLTENRFDAGIIVSGIPDSVLTELMKNQPVRLIPLTEKELAAGAAIGYFSGLISAGTYPGQDKDVTLLSAGKSHVLVRKGLPDDLVYEMVKIAFEHLDEIQAVHASFKTITRDTALGTEYMQVPVHPGAVKYLTQNGIWTGDDVTKNDALLARLLKDIAAKAGTKPAGK